MALFDRRLLAYFDDGLGAGSTTLLERIVDYQKDLAEIEKELKKYKMLLGDREVQCKIRDPERWIRNNGTQKTIKEKYRKVVQDLIDEQEEPELGYAERRRSTTTSRPSMARGKARSSRASIASRASISASQHRASPAVQGSRTGALWVQIDTISGLSRLPHPRPDKYTVRAFWLHHHATESTEQRGLQRNDSGEDVCIVRQQLKLEAQPTAQTVVIAVYGVSERLVGEIQLNVEDHANHEVQVHQLHDEYRRHSVDLCLRLAFPGTSHDPAVAATRGGVRSSTRLSAFAIPDKSDAPRRTSNQQGRRSIRASITEGSGTAQENRRASAHQSVQAVTQDPAALEPSTTQTAPGRLSHAAQGPAVQAAVQAAQMATEDPSTPAISEPPTPSVNDAPDEFDYEEEEEEEEQLESSLIEEYEEGEEEELAGDEAN